MRKVELTYGDIIIDLESSFVSIKVDGTNEEEKIETYGKCFEEKEPTGEEKEEHRKMPFKVFRYLDVNGSFKELLVFPTRDHKLFCLSCNEIKFLASNGYKPHMCDGFDVAGDFAEFTFAVNDSGQNLDLPLEIITITENGSIRKKTLKIYSKVEYSKDGGFIIAEDKEGYDFISKSGKLQMSGLNDIKFEWAIAINHEGDIENLNFISCFKKDPNLPSGLSKDDLAITVVMDNWSGNLVSLMGSDGADYEEAFYQLQDIYGISKKVIGEKEEKTGVIYHDFQGVASSGKNLVKVKGKLIPWRFKSSE